MSVPVLSHSQLRRLCGNLLTLSLETPCDGQGAAAVTGPHGASEASCAAAAAAAAAPRRLSSRVPLFERRVNRILNKATPHTAARAADEAFWLLTRGASLSPAGSADAAGAVPACGRWSDASDTAGAAAAASAAAAAAAGNTPEQWPEQAQKDAAAAFVRSLVSRAEAEAAPYGALYADVFSRVLDRLRPPPAATAEPPPQAATAAAAATAGSSPRATPLKRTLHNALVDRVVSRGGTASFQTLGGAAFCAGLFARGALPQQILHVTVRKVLRMRDGEVSVAAAAAAAADATSPPVSPDRSGCGGAAAAAAAAVPPTDQEVTFVMHLLSHCGQGLEVPSAKPFLDAYYQRLGAIAACPATHSLLRHRLHMLLERRRCGAAPSRAAAQHAGAAAVQERQVARFLVKRACARGALESEELDAAVLQPLLRACGGGNVTQVRRYRYHAVVSVTAPGQPSFRDLKALNELVRGGGFEVVAA